MKKRVVLMILALFLLKAVAYSQSLGLVYKLATVKSECETKLQLALLKKADGPSPEIVASYLAVKAAFDPLISQLIADIQARNSLKYYKKLDKLVKDSPDLGNLIATDDTDMEGYSKALKEAYEIYRKTNESVKASIAAGDVITAATLVYSIVKDAQDARVAKVVKVVALLESLRLSPVSSINKVDSK